MAPRAHLAIYKACGTCKSTNVLAAFDAAIKYGIDVLSLSIGNESAPAHQDAIAISAFTAMTKVIVVVYVGGNDGLEPGTISNAAPWILTVGVGTVDKSTGARMKFGIGHEFRPETISFQNNFKGQTNEACHEIKNKRGMTSEKQRIDVCNDEDYFIITDLG